MRETKKHVFIKEIKLMLYAFGDVQSPRLDTLITVHNYLCSYLNTLLIKTHNMAKVKGKTKTEDLLFFLKRDRKKYSRVKNLLKTNEELIRTRKIIDQPENESEVE
ncbi:TAF13 [Hepatospora eriocheir]|uniref:Transcription initiation factor TFIID subunit 13 n=1 Tax=Hepatospora eriocheir TaxID=1081669 RepID=A0A1X0QEK8_9MICR|nr:TAF13 [Hepatospora eriocheir]ORE00411.1 TAF13 [Hepatospora eriocheir]